MSGIFANLGAPGATEESSTRRISDALRPRGADRSATWSGDEGVIGASRFEWELAADFAGGVLVLDRESLVLAADATLYYRDDLRRALRAAGVPIEGDSPSHLIAAAYQAWGNRMLDRLEGDFAFILWDRTRRELLAARDFAGSRPLYFARSGSRLVLASSMTAVAAHPAVSRELNLMALTEDLVNASSMAVEETVFRNVLRLPAGCRLTWRPGMEPSVERFWEPPLFDRPQASSPAEAAEQLREVLGAACRERLASGGPTAVWTSGGYDSPAVFALAHSAALQGSRQAVVPVSMSYPEGDPGREDELVAAVGRHVGSPIHWVPIAGVPGYSDPWEWAGQRDQPFAHPYEPWNRALAMGARANGARVILGGNGGDQFFSVSPVFLADLARAGRWKELISEARAIGFGRRNLRQFFHWAVQPALPSGFLDLAARMRGGRPLRPHLVSPPPAWMGLSSATCDALWRRQWHYGLRRPGESLGSAETSWYLTAAFGQRICAMVMEIVLGAGAEARSPMYDGRVIEFMARRPRSDRFAQGHTKCLLRQAMTGLLPEEHLAPRARRTGLPSAYLQRIRREALPQWARTIGTRMAVEDLGLVSGKAVRGALDSYLATPRWEGTLGSELFNVYSAEFWLRTHMEGQTTNIALVA